MVDSNLFFILIFFAFGLCFGSFLNVIVYRMPQKISIIDPPSSCPACKNRLGVIDLIPLFGYLLLRGKCRYCAAGISFRYPLVELLTGLLFVVVFDHFSFSAEGFFYLALLYILFAVTLIDLEHRIVPNSLVAAGLIIGLLFYLPVLLSYLADIPPWLLIGNRPLDALLGFAVGGGLLLIIILVCRGGMGAGDMKLMAIIGLFVGLRGVAVVLLAAFIFGALVGIVMMILGKATRKDALPFAPYLALATVVEVFWGEAIWNWYINLIL